LRYGLSRVYRQKPRPRRPEVPRAVALMEVPHPSPRPGGWGAIDAAIVPRATVSPSVPVSEWKVEVPVAISFRSTGVSTCNRSLPLGVFSLFDRGGVPPRRARHSIILGIQIEICTLLDFDPGTFPESGIDIATRAQAGVGIGPRLSRKARTEKDSRPLSRCHELD
jgi:hypothetical protein